MIWISLANMSLEQSVPDLAVVKGFLQKIFSAKESIQYMVGMVYADIQIHAILKEIVRLSDGKVLFVVMCAILVAKLT